VLPKGSVVRVLLVRCCDVEPWVCPCANTWLDCCGQYYNLGGLEELHSYIDSDQAVAMKLHLLLDLCGNGGW
jgi:hypothetical protein